MISKGRVFAVAALWSVVCFNRAVAQIPEPSVESTIQQTVDQLFNYFKTGQGTRFRELYARDISVYKDGAFIADPQAYLISFSQGISQLDVHTLIWTRREVHVLTDDAAVFAGEFKETISSSASSEPRDYQVVWTALFRKIDGAWRIVHEHTSHVRPSR